MRTTMFLPRTLGIVSAVAAVAIWAGNSFAQIPDSPTAADTDAAQKAKDRAAEATKAQENKAQTDAKESRPGATPDKDASKSDASKGNNTDVFPRVPRSDRESASSDDSRDARREAAERRAAQRSDERHERADRAARNRDERLDYRDEARQERNARAHDRDDDRDRDRADRDDRGSRDDRDRDRDDERGDRRNLGLSFSDVTDDGITIANIESGGIIGRAGIRRGDVIHTVNGQRIHSQDDFYHWFNTRSRTPIAVVVLRDGRWQTINVQPLATALRTDRYYRYSAPAAPRRGGAYLGVTMDRRYQDEGVIRFVTPNSPADHADLRPGETILSVDGEDVQSPDHLSELIAQYDPGDEVTLEIALNDGRTEQIDVELSRRAAPRVDRFVQPRSYEETYEPQDSRYHRDGSYSQEDRYDDAPRRARLRVARPR